MEISRLKCNQIGVLRRLRKGYKTLVEIPDVIQEEAHMELRSE